MMNYLPSFLAVGTAIASAFAPQMQSYVAAHPQVTMVVAAAYSVWTHFLQPPANKKSE